MKDLPFIIFVAIGIPHKFLVNMHKFLLNYQELQASANHKKRHTQ